MDQNAFRQRFPDLGTTAYLSSCSLGARSTDLGSALNEMLAEMAAGGGAWHAFEARLESARHRFARLIGARDDQIAVVPNASIGAFQAASGFDWHSNDRIVTCRDEFPSIAQVWLAQRPRGARVTFTNDTNDPAGTDNTDDTDQTDADILHAYSSAIDEHTALVSVPLVDYQHSRRFPVADIAATAHEVGARIFVDAYQALGTQPVDVAALGCDYLVGGTMKYLLGLPGIAFLYCRNGLPDRREPELTGWFGRVDPFAFDPTRLDFPDTARRFETGTPAVPASYAADAGLNLIDQLDLNAVAHHISEIHDYATEQLRAIGGRVLTPTDHGAHVSLADPHPDALAAWLAARHVSVSPRGERVRVSIHYYTDEADIDELVRHLTHYRDRR